MEGRHGKGSAATTIKHLCLLPYKVKQVFTTMDFVGWYTIGSEPTHEDALFHQQVREKSTCKSFCQHVHGNPQ